MNQQIKFRQLLLNTECTCTTLWRPDSYFGFWSGCWMFTYI